MTIKELDAPKTHFTFWPHNNETDEIAKAIPEDLAEMAIEAKHITQLYHELWRTHRNKDMSEVTMEIINRGVIVTDEIFDQAPAKLATSEMLGANRSDNARFLTDTWTTVVKTMTGTPLDLPLPEDVSSRISEVVTYSLLTADDILAEKV